MLACAVIFAGSLATAAIGHGAEAPPDSVVKIDGCSGVCVHPAGLVLSAKHCDFDNREAVDFPNGTTIHARKVYESPETDGPIVFLADDVTQPLPYSPIAAAPPPVGSKVYSWGFPAGSQSHARNLTFAAGVVSGGRDISALEVGLLSAGPLAKPYRVNIVSGMAIDGGWSGGPLFNERGEVCGLASASNNESSLWIPFVATRAAYQVAASNLPAPAENREVMVYLQENCGPCRAFEADARKGKFVTYTFVPGDPTFSAIEGTPTFAYRGKLKTGYSGSADLLAWLAEVDQSAQPPVNAGRPEPVPDEPQPTPDPNVTPWRSPREDIAAIREQVETIITDIREFQEAGVIGKVAQINDLRADLEAAKATTSEVKSELDAARADYKAATDEHPWYYGIPAVVVGILKRRYLNRGAVVEA